MKLENEILDGDGLKYKFEYEDCDDFSILDKSKTTQTCAVCFVEDKICIVKNKRNTWGLIGGSIEDGETFEETLAREIKEEGNLKLLSCEPIGYQKVTGGDITDYIYQLRYFAIAEKYGDFVSDPADSIVEVAFIDIKDVKKYFDWGNIGDRILEIAEEKFKNRK